jgi:hypothetical protein
MFMGSTYKLRKELPKQNPSYISTTCAKTDRVLQLVCAFGGRRDFEEDGKAGASGRT